MKRIVLILSIALITTLETYADGNAFTPLNFNDTSYGTPSSYTQAGKTLSDIEAIGNGNIQNAIYVLRNRNNYKIIRPLIFYTKEICRVIYISSS